MLLAQCTPCRYTPRKFFNAFSSVSPPVEPILECKREASFLCGAHTALMSALSLAGSRRGLFGMKKLLQKDLMESYDGADDLCTSNRSACNSGGDRHHSHQRLVDLFVSVQYNTFAPAGPNALKALHRVTTYGQRGKFLPRHLHYTRILHPISGEVLDTSALCTFMPQPSTSTGAHALFLCVDSSQCRRRRRRAACARW